MFLGKNIDVLPTDAGDQADDLLEHEGISTPF